MNVEVSPTNENFPNMYNSMTNMFTHANPIVLTIITVVLILFFVMFHYLGISPYKMVDTETPKSTGIRIIETVMWGLLIFLILINGLQYIFKLDIKTALHDIMSEEPKLELTIKGEQKDLIPDKKAIRIKKQVFHIPDNKFSYKDAKAVCKAYDARLATQHEIDAAYRDGAEWCSYGWSEDQMALFPTQESTWFKLKKIKGHENDCGRPGINGGFIGDGKIKFGVNCFGYKPDMNTESRRLMRDHSPYPRTKEDKDLEKRVANFKKKMKKVPISSFNQHKWSQI